MSWDLILVLAGLALIVAAVWLIGWGGGKLRDYNGTGGSGGGY
jgi:hypothetical protein